MNPNDYRLNILEEFQDPRIIFVCLDYPDCPVLLEPFEGSTAQKLDLELDSFLTSALENSFEINMTHGYILLSKTFQIYNMDFNGDMNTILRFLFKYHSLSKYENESVIEGFN